MRLLIFLLALMSAFFVSAEQDTTTGFCLVFETGVETPMSEPSCREIATVFDPPYDSDYYKPQPNWGRVINSHETVYNGFPAVEYLMSCRRCGAGLSDVHMSPKAMFYYGDIPEPPPEDCPAGYHSLAVSKALGSSGCMPKECPPAGTGENLASTPMTGGVPFSGGGMYCNDGCAYSVNADQITSDKYAVGTSQGAACGDKPYDNKKLADEGDTGECSVSTGDVPLLSCPNANPTTPEKDPHNNDDSKTPEDETPEKPKETCAEGDAACNLKNVETEIENSTNKQIDNDNKLHNKKIDADTKNTNALLNILESIDTSILLQTQQDDRLHAVTVSKFNELVDAVNGIETGGSGGGGGGNGSGTGGDCEGDPSECVPIEGSEIPSETVNLNQYADKYDDWLPNAELPSEKCIVISTGRSLCLSFESFILLFQSISGLMVIGALMHSARIISGAI
ncbi:hypothetical protein PSEHALCIP103_00191 [Pseudoalteromonas haloplanktis]|uniref:Uncharacterized protein n=1 Tax=Pseudoalteromonas haloplanktis TaxID=228 RepID=A0A9W4VVF8_PSEHA|nr:hypothetical protein [Pseudoalteromonas haloplanktis]CAH9050419.1 hypothetical protein PSEHALCIP103_00191 [Pseudoalteromonas haloplanktis]